jgi:hypothetical protein
MELGHLLVRSGLTCPEVSSKVYLCSFCQSGCSVSLPWIIYYEAFCLHVVSSISGILVICPKLELFLTPLQFVHLFCSLSIDGMHNSLSLVALTVRVLHSSHTATLCVKAYTQNDSEQTDCIICFTTAHRKQWLKVECLPRLPPLKRPVVGCNAPTTYLAALTRKSPEENITKPIHENTGARICHWQIAPAANERYVIIIIFINCNWVVTRWQWLFNTYTKHEIGFLLNLRREGYMRSM